MLVMAAIVAGVCAVILAAGFDVREADQRPGAAPAAVLAAGIDAPSGGGALAGWLPRPGRGVIAVGTWPMRHCAGTGR